MNEKIKTETMFAMPLGQATLSKEVCDMFKPLTSETKNEKGLIINLDVLQLKLNLKKKITDVFTEWVNNTYNFEANQKWAMLTNWITENHTGNSIPRHRHYNCTFSSVFYFDKIENGEGNLILENPNDFADLYPADQRQLSNIYNKAVHIAPLYEGLIIFFASSLYHSYHQFENKNKKNRRSFACNFAPIGMYGSIDSFIDTNWLSYVKEKMTSKEK